MTTPPETDREWHLDKRVPIAVIITLIIQTAAMVWWASSLDARVSALEAEAVGRPQRRDAIQTQLSDIKAQMAAMKEKTDGTNKAVDELKGSINTLIQRVMDDRKRPE